MAPEPRGVTMTVMEANVTELIAATVVAGTWMVAAGVSKRTLRLQLPGVPPAPPAAGGRHGVTQ